MAPRRPSEIWTDWLAELGPRTGATTVGGATHGTWMTRTLPGLMRDRGFQCPVQRQILGTAKEGLAEARGREDVYNFMHFLNLLWQPLLHHIDCLANGAESQWSETLARHDQALTAEMQGIISDPGDVMYFSLWVKLICRTLQAHLAVDVTPELVTHVVTLVAPNPLPATPAMAMHIIRSSLCIRMVGAGMAAQASRKTLSKIAEQPVALLSEPQLMGCLKQDLVTLLTQRACPAEEEDEAGALPPVKRRRDSESTRQALRDKTEQMWYCLRNKVSLRRCEDTVVEAVSLAQKSAMGPRNLSRM